ncbi:protein GUCD1-like [Clavelina lepadiformis]|uniref:protein GUCD1-like n=1 Tax=Clavelina lepadiformis TaxID=159417 RepID=UPI00404339F1
MDGLLSTLKTQNNDIPDNLSLSISHVKQGGNWDCGIACLHMLLKGSITQDEINFAIKKHLVDEQVWTVDLAYICSMLGVQHKLFTVTLGANDNFSEEPFYVDRLNEKFSTEKERINKLFNEATANKVTIKKKSIKLEEIIIHLAVNKRPLIVLIDDTKMVRIYSNPITSLCNKLKSLDTVGDTAVEPRPFWGHYILVTGYDLTKQTIKFKDPSNDGEKVYCSMQCFEEARKSFGTDEDILFTY